MQETELRVGYNSHRLKVGDPYHKKEIDFVKAINNFIRGNNNTLSEIINSPNNGGYLDEHEEKIVLSVIQWLGTPVGQGFLEKVEKM